MNVLYVEVKNVYGLEKVYPRTPAKFAEAVVQLTGKKTIDEDDVKSLNALGIQVKPKLYCGMEFGA